MNIFLKPLKFMLYVNFDKILVLSIWICNDEKPSINELQKHY